MTPDNPPPQEAVNRALALIERMSGNSSIGRPFGQDEVIRFSSGHYLEARAIAALLPKSVDPAEAWIKHNFSNRWTFDRVAVAAAYHAGAAHADRPLVDREVVAKAIERHHYTRNDRVEDDFTISFPTTHHGTDRAVEEILAALSAHTERAGR